MTFSLWWCIPLGDSLRTLLGESHDGEYALRRYIRIVEAPKNKCPQ